MVWHQATCGTLRWDKEEVRWVEGEAIKACSMNPGELAVWAKERREELKYCTFCQHDWEKEHRTAPSNG